MCRRTVQPGVGTPSLLQCATTMVRRIWGHFSDMNAEAQIYRLCRGSCCNPEKTEFRVLLLQQWCRGLSDYSHAYCNNSNMLALSRHSQHQLIFSFNKPQRFFFFFFLKTSRHQELLPAVVFSTLKKNLARHEHFRRSYPTQVSLTAQRCCPEHTGLWGWWEYHLFCR